MYVLDNDAVFKKYREPVNDCKKEISNYHQLYEEACLNGDYQKAYEYLARKRMYVELREEEQRIALEKIFSFHNSKLSENEIDLHGLFEDEAVVKLEQKVKLAWERNLRQLIVITGLGKHSKGKPKLKRAAEEFAKMNDIDCRTNPLNEGRVIFEFNQTPVYRVCITRIETDCLNFNDSAAKEHCFTSNELTEIGDRSVRSLRSYTDKNIITNIMKIITFLLIISAILFPTWFFLPH